MMVLLLLLISVGLQIWKKTTKFAFNDQRFHGLFGQSRAEVSREGTHGVKN